MFKQILLAVIFTTTMLGQVQAPKEPSSIPKIPTEYRLRLQKLVIRQQRLQIDQAKLATRYQEDVKALEQVNVEGMKLESELMQSLSLDPAKYTTETNDAGDVSVVKREKK